jgi:hypothetical protein
MFEAYGRRNGKTAENSRRNKEFRGISLFSVLAFPLSLRLSIDQPPRPAFDQHFVVAGRVVAQGEVQVFVRQGDAVLGRPEFAQMDAVAVLFGKRCAARLPAAASPFVTACGS